MEVKIINQKGEAKGETTLPEQFEEAFRPDLIKKAVLSLQSCRRTPYGAYPKAGQEFSAKLSKRRRNYRGSYNKGIARGQRKIMSRNGTQMHMVGAISPYAVGGRRAYPPKSEKSWIVKINDKERRKAIRSALGASLNKQIVENRGHKLPKNYPFIIDNEFETITKTKQALQALKAIGLEKELERAAHKKIRAGRGKMRGRVYKKTKGPLIVVGKECPLKRASKNLPGIEIVKAQELNAELLAPGTHAGRLTLYTTNAITEIKGGLFK